MSTVQTPHFDLPFRLGPAGAAVVEQDTIDDVANCVVTILSVPYGWRDEAPSFGIPDLTFRNYPIGADDISGFIGEQEPRAILTVTEQFSFLDPLIDTINIKVDKVSP